jgi:hypothetical protein
MAFLIAILTLLVAGVVVLIVGAPLQRARRMGSLAAGASIRPAAPGERAPAASMSYQPQQLEAAREAKYREIRDTELDFRTGKLSREDYEAIDADLRAEAIDILNRLQPADRQAAEPVEEQQRPRSGPGTLQQQEGVQEEHHRKEDRPAI